MTIRKGEPWGEEVPRPHWLRVAGSDAELAGLVAEHGDGPYGLSGGDLYAVLGRPNAAAPVARCLQVDALRVSTDHGTTLAIAHVVLHQRWMRGPVVAVANVSRRGEWDAVPTAHPNDGRFETVEVDASMPLRQRLQARRRMRTGTHMPHPHIRVRHVTQATFTFPRPMRCEVDGVVQRPTRSVEVSLIPDAFTLIV